MSGFERALERLLAVIERRHRAVVLGSVVLLVLSASSLLRLRLDMDVLSQLPSDSKVFRDYKGFLNTFGAFDSLIVLLSGEPADLPPFAEALAEKLRALPEVGAVRYRIEVDAVRRQFLAPHRFALLGDAELDELARRLAPDAIRERVHGLRRALAMPMSVGARRWLVDDPLGLDALVGTSIERGYADPLFRPTGEYFASADGREQLMIVRPVASAFDTIFAERLMNGVRAAEQSLLDGPYRGKARVGHTGSYAYALADKRVIQGDLQLYFVFAPLAVLAIFHLGLRTLRILPFVSYPLLVSTAVTFALSLFLYGSLNMVSVAFAGIFYGLGIDSSIYFYALLREKTRERALLDEAAIRGAVRETLREIGLANVLASVTTAVAFCAVGFSHFTGVAELGQMTAVAMLLNVIATFVLLPAMVFTWGPSAVPLGEPVGSVLAERVGRASVWLHRRRSSVLAATILLLLACAAGLPRVRLDTDFTHLRPSGGEAAQVEETIAREFGRVDAQGIVIARAPLADHALEIAERVAAVLEDERKAGRVRSYSTLTALFPSHATAERRLARVRALPFAEAARALRAALAAERFDVTAFEPALARLTPEAGAAPDVTRQEEGPLAGLVEQHLRARRDETAIATYFLPAPGVPLAEVAARLERALEPAPVTVVGRELVEHEFARLLESEVAGFVGIALLLNLGVLLAAEWSLRRSLALLTPTLVALLVYLGVIGCAGVAIDPINLIVLPLLIGLGVDDCVYLVAHARHGGGLERGVARGIIALSLAVGTTLAGFGSLGLSRFPALGHLGSLAAFGLSLCLLATIVLVPALAWPVVAPSEDGEEPRGS